MATDFTLFPHSFTHLDKHFRIAPFVLRKGRERNERGMPEEGTDTLHVIPAKAGIQGV